MDYSRLSTISLFQNMSEKEFSSLHLDQYRDVNYLSKSIVASEGDTFHALGIVLAGTLALQQLSDSGNISTIHEITTNDSFGAAQYHSNTPTYPFTIVSLTPSEVLYIPFPEISLLLGESPTFRDNFITLISSRVVQLKDKLKIVNHKDVRSRLLLYLNEEYKKSGTNPFLLSHSKLAIAELLGVARPSLSREFNHLMQDGLIQMKGRTITITNETSFFK